MAEILRAVRDRDFVDIPAFRAELHFASKTSTLHF